MEQALNENERVESTAQSEPNSEPQSESNSEPAKVNRLFNIVSLAFACVLFAAQIFLLIAMGTGIVAVNGITFNSTEITHFVKLLIIRGSAYDIPSLTCLAIVAGGWIALLIPVIIGLVKAIIGIFRFFKLGEEYESRQTKFGKYVKTVSGSYGGAIALVALSLAFTPSFTAMGTGVVVLGCIIYLASSTILILFKQVFNKEEKFDLFELIVNVGKKLVMFMIAFLLVANIKESFNIGLENTFNDSLLNIDDAKKATAAIYFNIAQPMSLIVIYSCVAAILAYIVQYYPLNNGKKDVNVLLRQSFIALLVLTLLYCVSDCVMYGLVNDASGGDYVKLIADDWLGYLLVSISGIIMTCITKAEKEQIRG